MMAVNCQAAVEAGACPSLERSQSLTPEDSASMTIEFLRARLLSERAASKTARQQAQQIAKKVSELQSRLDMEIDLRKKAQAEAKKVFAALKIKGLSTEDFAEDDCEHQTEKNESEEGLLSSDNANEVDTEQQLCDEISCCIDEERAAGLEFKILAGHSEMGEKTVPHGQIAVRNVDAQVSNGDQEKVYDEKESKELNADCKAQCADIQSSAIIGIKEEESPSDHLKEMKGTPDDTAGGRQVIAQKRTELSEKIDVDVETNSEGQTQKLEQQGQIEQISSSIVVKESSGCLELHESNSRKSHCSDASSPMHVGPEHSNEALSNDMQHQTDARMAPSESESFKHAEGLLRLAGKVNSELSELAQKKIDERQTLSHSMQGNHLNGSKIDVGPLDWPFTLMDKSQTPMYAEIEQQYGTWMSSSAHQPCLFASQMIHAQYDCMGTQLSYPAEIQSARDMGDSLTNDSGNTRPVHWHGYPPQAKANISESPTEHPQISVTEYCNDTDAIVSVSENQEAQFARTPSVGHTNGEYERGHAYHSSTAYSHGKSPLISPRLREGFGSNLSAQRHTRAPVSDVARTLVYDKNGSVGDILTALHLAKLQVKGDEHSLSFPDNREKPSTSHLVDEFRQLPHDGYPWWSQVPQTPFVQCPSSPSLDNLDDGSIRSNSGSPVPAFEADIQPSGKVHLGNGIILYTD